MATISIVCQIVNDFESQTITLSTTPATSSGAPLIAQKGDTIQFVFQGDGLSYSFNIQDWDEPYWAGSGLSPDQPSGGEINRPLSLSASVGQGYTTFVTFVAYYAGSPYYFPISIRILDNVDGTPDAFNVGGPLSFVSPSTDIVGNIFEVRGLTVAASASCTAGSAFTVNNGVEVTSASVVNGDMIQFRVRSSTGWGVMTSGTLTIGGVSSTLQVTTAPEPSYDQLIDFPKTAAPVSLRDVIDFFGGTYTPAPAPKNMLAYVKGSAYVPNISKNSKIPFSAPLKLTDFLGSATALLFTDYPKSQDVSGYTTHQSVELDLSWTVGITGQGGFDLGYGPGMKGAVEYRYRLVQESNGWSQNGIDVMVPFGPHTEWSSGNYWVVLKKNVPHNQEAHFQGTLYIDVRSKYNHAVIITASVRYSLDFYGP